MQDVSSLFHIRVILVSHRKNGTSPLGKQQENFLTRHENDIVRMDQSKYAAENHPAHALARAKVSQHLRFDVAAANNRNIETCFGQLMAMEEESGNGDGTARLGDGFGILGQ